MQHKKENFLHFPISEIHFKKQLTISNKQTKLLGNEQTPISKENGFLVMQSYSYLTYNNNVFALSLKIHYQLLTFQQNHSGCFWNHSSNSNSWTGNESTSRHAAESLLKNFGKGIGISNIIIIKFALAVKWIWGWHKWFQLCLLISNFWTFRKLQFLVSILKNYLRNVSYLDFENMQSWQHWLTSLAQF